jgi:hypothetical protein
MLKLTIPIVDKVKSDMKTFIIRFLYVMKILPDILLREISCLVIKKSYKISPLVPRYLIKFLPFIKVDEYLLKYLENAICLSKLSVSKKKIVSPVDLLCVSNPSCFEVNGTIYVVYTIHNHKVTASRRFSYTDKSGATKIGFGLSIITSDGQQKNLGTANLDNDTNICDFRCISLETGTLISCSFESDGIHRIGWCVVPFSKLDQGPSKWIFCLENSPFDFKTEKNWAPISYGKDNFKFIYRPEEKNKISKSSLNTINKNKLLLYSDTKTFSMKSGGSPYLKLGKKFLASIHQTFLSPYRNYLHFFALGQRVQGDKFELQISKNSFFFFEPMDTEFCCGICEIDDCVIFSFGFRDSEAWLMKFKKKKLLEILNSSFEKNLI